MSETQSKIIRFLKSHIFRIILSATALFSTVFFPLVYAYPLAEKENRNLIIVFIVFAAAVEVMIFIIVSHYLVYGKVKAAAKRLTDMAKSGEAEKMPTVSIDSAATAALEAVNITADEYARLEQVRKSFVANASHELRSPLTSVQGFLQAVLDGTVTEQDKEKYLKIALSETKRLNSLITSMLDLSRLDSGKNPLEIGRASCRERE